jgi:hypothetical protein
MFAELIADVRSDVRAWSKVSELDWELGWQVLGELGETVVRLEYGMVVVEGFFEGNGRKINTAVAVRPSLVSGGVERMEFVLYYADSHNNDGWDIEFGSGWDRDKNSKWVDVVVRNKEVLRYRGVTGAWMRSSVLRRMHLSDDFVICLDGGKGIVIGDLILSGELMDNRFSVVMGAIDSVVCGGRGLRLKDEECKSRDPRRG